MLAAIGAEIARCASRAGEQAGLLQGVGARAFETTGDLARGATPAELLDRAQRVRALGLHALCVLMDLEYQAGRLDALAAVKRAAEENATAGR